MSDDSHSVTSAGSTTSASLSKMECPYCNKDLQIRSMFKHIRLNHASDFLKNTNAKWIREAEAGNALKLWWESKNDFGEDEMVVLFACLSTNKTFLSEARAVQHFKKDKDALKDHNKQIKQLRKDFDKYKKLQEQEEANNPIKKAIEMNDPAFARACWSGILMYLRICEHAIEITKAREYSDTLDMYVIDKLRFNKYDSMPYRKFIDEYYGKLVKKVNKLKAEKCLDAKRMFKLWTDVKDCKASFAESIPWSGLSSWSELREDFPEFTFTEELFGVAGPDMPKINF